MAILPRKMNNRLFYYLSFIILFLGTYTMNAQTIIKGIVLEKNTNSTTSPLIGAVLRWKNAQQGTVADTSGRFTLSKTANQHELIVSFIGYQSDTLMVHSDDFLTIYLRNEGKELTSVMVTASQNQLDELNPIHSEYISMKTLTKAACCNLSESFETNASVSVSYTDGVTGAKQIQLLGLSGNYVQINQENIPSIRGLGTTFGLNYIPGTWLASIDVGKGAGSVVNGYESMTGALNIELQKPENSDKLSVNAYLNSFGRGELNVNTAKELTQKWSVALLTHASGQQAVIDQNHDGFKDMPTFGLVNVLNRWKYQSEKMMAQVGIKALYENRLGGQDARLTNALQLYQFGNTTKRVEFFTKTAQLFLHKPYKGLGLIINGTFHDADAYFGLTSRKYQGQQKSLYSNLIYQNIIQTTNNTYKLGASFVVDDYNEKYLDSTFKRTEIVPGAFGEYTLTIPQKLTLVVGGRVDFHNLYGTRFTPRVHAKYDLTANNHLRMSAGKGWRMPNTIAENFGMLVNNRALQVLEVIRPEESWNYGVSLSNDFTLGSRKGSVVLDFYRTDFQNQLIVDMESAAYLRLYNLKGRSFSNSFQTEVNYSPLKRLEVKLAYRYFDVENDIQTVNRELVLLPKMYVNKDRVLFNAGYATKFDKWKFDVTWQWNGKRRIPDASHNHVHEANSVEQFAPAFSTINAQITRGFLKWELYLGGENLTGFKQPNPIMYANNPFGSMFDASMVWGPITGQMVYVGFRKKISKIN